MSNSSSKRKNALVVEDDCILEVGRDNNTGQSKGTTDVEKEPASEQPINSKSTDGSRDEVMVDNDSTEQQQDLNLEGILKSTDIKYQQASENSDEKETFDGILQALALECNVPALSGEFESAVRTRFNLLELGVRPVGKTNELHRLVVDDYRHFSTETLLKKKKGVSLAKETNEKGQLALHLSAGTGRGFFVGRLLGIYADGVKVRDQFGKLPIHYAAMSQSSNNGAAVKQLLKVFPESAEVKDNLGNLPIHYAVKSWNNNDVVTKLLRVFPEGAKRKDGDSGLFPIHHAATPEMMVVLAETFPDGVKQVDNATGQFPIHKLTMQLSNKCRDERSYLEKNWAIKRLVELYPEGAGHRDLKGNTPIHLTRHQGDFMILAKNYPKCLGLPKADGQLPLDQWLEEQLHCGETIPTAFLELLIDQRQQTIKTIKSLELERKAGGLARKMEQSFWSRQLKSKSKSKVDTIEKFIEYAKYLKARLDLLKESKMPGSQPSVMQMTFESFLVNPELTKESLKECIQILEQQLAPFESAENNELTLGSTGTGSGTSNNGPAVKRPRVSLP